MKQKLIASLLAASMLLTLSACGGKDNSTPTSATDSEQTADTRTDSEPATDAPDETVADNAAPVNGIQLYDGSYLDLDGEYASGVPCRRMGGSEIAASDTTVNFIWNRPMSPNEEGYQEGVIAETYQWDINVTSPTPFMGIPAGAETCWNIAATRNEDVPYEMGNERTTADDKASQYETDGSELYEPGETSNTGSFQFSALNGILITANETSEPIDRYHFSPIALQLFGGNSWEDYDDDTSGKPGGYTCIGGKAPHSFDDIIASYGEPMGVYGTKESNTTYVWKATGDADVYVLAKYNAQAEHPSITISYIKDCETFKSNIEEYPLDTLDIPNNLYDILSELGLYTE